MFAVIASGVGLDYQWQFNGTNLAGATNSTLTLTNVRPEQAGTYTVIVSNSFGTNARSAGLDVMGRLRINSQPANQTLPARIRQETELWGRTEYFPVDAYWKHAARLHEAGVDVLSCVSINRAESGAILDRIAGLPASPLPEPEALLLLDMAPEEPSSHRL